MIYATGTVALTANSNVISGLGTLFTQEAKAGGFLYIYTIPRIFRITEIVNDTRLLVDNPLSLVNGVSGLIFALPDHFSPNLGLPLPTPHQLSVQTQTINRAWRILDREIPSQY